MGLPKPKGGWKPTPDDQRSPFEHDSSSQKGKVGGVSPCVSSDPRPVIKRFVGSSEEHSSSQRDRNVTYAQYQADVRKETVCAQDSAILKKSTFVPLEEIPQEQFQRNLEESKKMSDPSFNFIAWARKRREQEGGKND